MARSTMCSLLLLSALALTAAEATAQTTLSVRGGGSIATFGGADAESPESRAGLNLGAALTFPVAPNLGLQLGAAYVQKGASESEEGVEATFSLDYFEVPVLLRLEIPTTGALSPHFFAGPALGFKSKCEVSMSYGGASVTAECGPSDIPVKSFDIGAMLGAGLDIATAGPLSVTLDVSYDVGLASVDDSSDPDDVKNRAWSILAGVAFTIG